MTEAIATALEGGCACGAVRIRIAAIYPLSARLCWCRMCQKAAGNLFAALVTAPRDAATFAAGAPAIFRSSASASRGFCRDCGTPLFCEGTGGGRISLMIGALDRPQDYPPRENVGIERRFTSFAAVAVRAVTAPCERPRLS